MGETGESIPEVVGKHIDNNFVGVVLESQSVWRSLQKKPHETLSQAWHLPNEKVQHFYGLILDSLPKYIEESTKETIVKNHPTPAVGFSVLMDKRLVKAKETAPFIFMMDIPDGSNSEAWIVGMNTLNEIATDTLALEVLKAIPKSETESLTKEILSLISKLPGATPKRAGVTEAEGKLKEILEGANYDEFKQRLVNAMLSGDTTKVGGFLKERELDDLDKIALQLSEKTSYGTQVLKAVTDKSRLAKVIEKARFMVTAGHASISYPGVLGLFILQAIRNPQSIPRTVVHEVCHYIGQDKNHFGLFKGEYQRISRT